MAVDIAKGRALARAVTPHASPNVLAVCNGYHHPAKLLAIYDELEAALRERDAARVALDALKAEAKTNGGPTSSGAIVVPNVVARPK